MSTPIDHPADTIDPTLVQACVAVLNGTATWAQRLLIGFTLPSRQDDHVFLARLRRRVEAARRLP